jgi:hypothetical protein
MNRNQYRLPVRGTGVGSQYSMADSVRDDRLSGDGDAITAALPKATYDAGDRMTLDAVSKRRHACMHVCAVRFRARCPA